MPKSAFHLFIPRRAVLLLIGIHYTYSQVHNLLSLWKEKHFATLVTKRDTSLHSCWYGAFHSASTKGEYFTTLVPKGDNFGLLIVRTALCFVHTRGRYFATLLPKESTPLHSCQGVLITELVPKESSGTLLTANLVPSWNTFVIFCFTFAKTKWILKYILSRVYLFAGISQCKRGIV